MNHWSGEAWYLDGSDVSSSASIQVIEHPTKRVKSKGKGVEPVPFGFGRVLPSKKSKKSKKRRAA